MGERHALLIGVPADGQHPRLSEIPDSVVQRDLEEMSRALLESGYAVTVLGAQPKKVLAQVEYKVAAPAVRNWCQGEMARIAAQVDTGGTLIIYFTGHGVQVDGVDYLVPAGLHPATPLDETNLLPLDLGAHLAACEAGTVVYFIDACRNAGDNAPAKPVSVAAPHHGSVALVKGCAREQVCGFDTEGSWFTRYLAQALQRNTAPRSLGEVIAAVAAALERDGLDQRPDLTQAGPTDPLQTVICEGVKLLDDWRRAARDADLWDLCRAPRSDVAEAKAAVDSLVGRYAHDVETQRDNFKRHPHGGLPDPWTDDDYPGRVLRCTHLLLTPPDGQRRISLAETAVLVAAPFLREAVLALGLFDVPGVQPRVLDRTFEPGLRDEFEDVLISYESLCRSGRDAAAAGSPEDRDQIAMWLVHRWLLERDDLWAGPTVSQWMRELAEVLGRIGGWPTAGGYGEELAGLVRVMVESLGSPLGPRTEAIANVPGSYADLAPCAMGFLLGIAGVLAADLRRFGGLLVEHVGTKDRVGVEQFRHALRDRLTGFAWSGDNLDLDLMCDHPAAHEALYRLTREADEACAHARKVRTQLPERDRYLLYPPARCTAGRVRPRGSSYDQPLMYFRVDDARVQELLMGIQLYGDAEVAIRELYQNALDACRYREMRLRYAKKDPSLRRPGRIIFTEGQDDMGRYVECRDDGVGMTEEVLQQVFTRAGNRFVYTEKFRREQARWRGVDRGLRLYPNSQFGIGVFSYFMLANDLFLWTSPTNEFGSAERGHLHLRVAGHGGLLRLQRVAEPRTEISDGGTLVRLYLAGDKEVSCADVLSRYLVVSEHHVSVVSNGEPTAEWLPGIPKIAGRVEPHPGNQHVWWIDGSGVMLADGIRIGRYTASNDDDDRRTSRPYGRIVNLTGRRLPRLSVDRSELIAWDAGWVAAQVANVVPRLVEWPGFTWAWLWKVCATDPDTAAAIYDRLASHPIPIDEDRREEVTISAVGLVACDSLIFNTLQDSRYHAAFWARLLPWRHSVWAEVAGGHQYVQCRPDGYPQADPVDHTVLEAIYDVVTVDLADDPPSFVRLRSLSGDEVRYRLRRLAFAGVSDLDIRGGQTATAVDDPAALVAVAMVERLTLSDPWLFTMVLSRLTGRTIADVAAAHPWRGLDGEIDVAAMPAYVVDGIDLMLVSEDLDAQVPWTRAVGPRQIAAAVKRLGLTREQCEARLARLRCLGVEVVEFDSPRLRARDPKLATRLTGVDHWLNSKTRLGAIDLLSLAADKRCSVAAARDMVTDAAGRLDWSGRVPPLPVTPDADPSTFVPTPEDIALLNGLLRPRTVNRPSETLLSNMIANVVSVNRNVPTEDQRAVARRCYPYLGLPDTAEVPYLIDAAGQAGASLQVAADQALALLGGRRLTRTLAPVTTDLDLYPSDADREALLSLEGGAVTWREVRAFDIVQHAVSSRCSIGRSLSVLARYRPLGARVPPCTDDGLDGYAPVAEDTLALTATVNLEEPPSHQRRLPDELVTPLHLLRVAGRIGWTVREAYERLARFAPLGVTMTMTAADCPDEIVYWQDWFVLTEHFDGHEPAATGPITEEHIERAAHAVRDKPDETRARLRKYANLFKLEMP